MKQVLQNMRDGKTSVVEVPQPKPRPGTALVRTCASLVSAGTERMLVEFAEKNLLGKVRSRPDLVRQVLDKARREGLLTTIEAAFNRLDQPMVLGYSSAGVIEEVGPGLKGFKPGDRVACAGGGFAVHAEYAVVPQNLLIPIPENVDYESAAFSTLGAIAMHGFRLAHPQLGERVAIIGMGLLGLMAAGIARAAGCQPFGIDLAPDRIELAHKLGFTCVSRPDALAAGRAFTGGAGFDSILICADTRSNDPVELAGALARDRGVVVAVGAVGLNIPRKVYYEKELKFFVSRSYGPGRYDPEYEEKGHDYPPAYVRWTEGRNIAAFIDLLSRGQFDVHPLITHRYPIDQAPSAYELITGKSGQTFLGVILTYPDNPIPDTGRRILLTSKAEPAGEIHLGVLGSGNYANAIFLPIVQKVGRVTLTGIASGGGLSAATAARRFGFRFASSEEKDILGDEQINLVAVLTRHSSHARQIMAAIQAGKHVFCEKPLAITSAEVDQIEKMLEQHPANLLTVGFNRRFAPYAVQLKKFFSQIGEPLSLNYRVNAGLLPLTHWTQDPAVGGGRIVGEGCHFIDLMTYITGSLPISVNAVALPDVGQYRQDNVHLTITFMDGSVGTLTYLANGDKSVPKERLEVFSAGRVGILDDFRSLELVKDGRRQKFSSNLRQDKGHAALWEAFLNAVQHGTPAPIPYADLLAVTRATLAAMASLQSSRTEPVLTSRVG